MQYMCTKLGCKHSHIQPHSSYICAYMWHMGISIPTWVQGPNPNQAGRRRRHPPWAPPGVSGAACEGQTHHCLTNPPAPASAGSMHDLGSKKEEGRSMKYFMTQPTGCPCWYQAGSHTKRGKVCAWCATRWLLPPRSGPHPHPPRNLQRFQQSPTPRASVAGLCPALLGSAGGSGRAGVELVCASEGGDGVQIS